MNKEIVELRKGLVLYSQWLRHHPPVFRSQFGSFAFFIVAQMARPVVYLTLALLELPFHCRYSSIMAFGNYGVRDEHGKYLESYTGFNRRMRTSLLVVMLAVVTISSQVLVLGYGIYTATRPTRVEAYTTSNTITAGYDITSKIDLADQYSCESATATTLKVGMDSGFANWFNANIQFGLGDIPYNASITKVEFIAYVTSPFSANDTRISRHADDMPSLSCEEKQNGYQQTYVTASWTTVGSKTIDLGATAVTDVQSRINGSDLLSLSLYSATGSGNQGAMYSMNNATNKPQLRVTYTIPPQAPTAASPNHSAITTSSITWNWIDHATEDSAVTQSQRIVSGATVMCSTTGDGTTTGATMSCQETGLAANTATTRKANTVDPNGNTNGPDMTAYTAIETPTGINFDVVSYNRIRVSAAGTISNLTSGSSGLYFAESVAGSNSGWIQTNSWGSLSFLIPNKQYSYTVKARNGDSVQTTATTAATKYTLPVTSTGISSSQAARTWVAASPAFSNNDQPFGEGTLDHFRYVWNTSPTHTFAGTETSWSNNNNVTPTTSASGNSYYFHVQAYNAENAPGTVNDDGEATQTDLGPFYVDLDPPTAPPSVSVSDYSSSLTQVPASWAAASDIGSGVDHYQYAVGSTPGGTDELGWTGNVTGTSTTITGLDLTNGQTYYVSVRAIDGVNRVGAARNSSAATVNTAAPVIEDLQSGDLTPRRSGGTAYNVDFSKAATGPTLSYGQYEVYSGPNQTGTVLKNWTDIFRPDGATYTSDWTVDFSALQEGTNYVSVRTAADDGLVTELVDAFVIIKDTIAPDVSSFVSAPTDSTAVVSWTTNEPATTQLAYGTTTGYGTTTTLDTALTTSHTVTLTGLAATTLFHAQALSVDAAGNSTSSSDLTFSTSAGPHTYITNVVVTITGDTTATVTWTTNEPATSKVRYGTTTDYGSEVTDLSLVTSHTVLLTGLTAGQRYHYEVISVGSTTDHDADATFTTTSTAPTPTTVTATVAAPTITTVQLPKGATDPLVVVGRGKGGQTIYVYVDGKRDGSTKITGSSTRTKAFRVTVSRKHLPAGHHTITTKAKNSDGTYSQASKGYKIVVHAQQNKKITTSKSATYVVQSGDSLWKIATQFLGQGVTYNQLVQANIHDHPSLATNPSLIQPGWTLRIPAH